MVQLQGLRRTTSSIHSTVKFIYDVLTAVSLGTVTSDLIDPTQLAALLSSAHLRNDPQPLFPPNGEHFYYPFLDAALTLTNIYYAHIPFESQDTINGYNLFSFSLDINGFSTFYSHSKSTSLRFCRFLTHCISRFYHPLPLSLSLAPHTPLALGPAFRCACFL